MDNVPPENNLFLYFLTYYCTIYQSRTQISLDRLWLGPKGTAWNRFGTYIKNFLNKIKNSPAFVTMSLNHTFRYSAGLFLLTIIFVVYFTPYWKWKSCAELSCYADDILFYISAVPVNTNIINFSINCLYSMEQWMSFPNSNGDKTLDFLLHCCTHARAHAPDD